MAKDVHDYPRALERLLAAIRADPALAEDQRQASALRRRYLLKGLSEHHRLLYQLVEAEPGLEFRQLWRQYIARARAGGLMLMTRQRTMNHYLQYLVANRLLVTRQARGRSNQRWLEAVA